MNPYLKGANTLRAFDHAGNFSDFNFKIPELCAIKIKSENPLYDNFKGISAVAPSTLERSHTFDFSEPVGGVSAVSIDGPQGTIFDRTFDPPVSSTSTVLSDLPVGNYIVQSFNSVGAETKTPFLRNFRFSLVGNHNPYVFQSLTANPVNVMTVEIIARTHNAVLLAKRYTASYARGVALCPPLALRKESTLSLLRKTQVPRSAALKPNSVVYPKPPATLEAVTQVTFPTQFIADKSLIRQPPQNTLCLEFFARVHLPEPC